MRIPLAVPVLVLFSPCLLSAQAVNGYAAISSITGPVLTISAANESAASFATGKLVILLQMQDDVIGANTGNNVNFGDLSSIKQAGSYEVRKIVSVTRSAGVLNKITLNAAPTMGFNTGLNSSVQAVTFELLGGGGDFTTVANITAIPWNGALGGVVAFKVVGTLTVAHNITADGAGFRGGARDPSYFSSPCVATTYRASSTASNTNEFATKGEGIYKLTNSAWADGRGKLLNAGGGGNMINGGGGGGGNFSAGGSAVRGWSCNVDAGGIGGIALNAQISASRVFMGGGGGGGEGNDNVSTDGAPGGGVILITANAIRTIGSCAGRRISANGGTAANSGNDGAGGGGAGGSIVLECPDHTFATGCPMVISANGGAGGSVGDASTHSGGGGGGQGVVVFSSNVPTGNITVQTLNGQGGCNQAGCTTRAFSGAGPNNVGILSGTTGVLPIELVRFAAQAEMAQVALSWTTATEQDNLFFTIERSKDALLWEDVLQLPGAGNSSAMLDYSAVDPGPFNGTSYYRLRQTDINGMTSTSAAVPVFFSGDGPGFMLFPNPAKNRTVLRTTEAVALDEVVVLNDLGQVIDVPKAQGSEGIELDITGTPPGIYLVVVRSSGPALQQRLLVSP